MNLRLSVIINRFGEHNRYFQIKILVTKRVVNPKFDLLKWIKRQNGLNDHDHT